MNLICEGLAALRWLPDGQSFFERSASKSGIGRQAYQVQCGQELVVPSAVWLLDELKWLRAVS